jgi:hypothetical protein
MPTKFKGDGVARQYFASRRMMLRYRSLKIAPESDSEELSEYGKEEAAERNPACPILSMRLLGLRQRNSLRKQEVRLRASALPN